MGLRDMYSAISALDGDSTWLDVIGNNIANVNTIAYKASRVEFADAISQTLYGGTGDDPAINTGGVDPEQVGLGTRIASITTLFTEGTLQQTGVSTDVAIVGNGFLVSKSGDQTYLTRAGNLTFDSSGNLVDQNGGLIQGFTASIQYTQTTIMTAADNGVGAQAGNPLQITAAKLTLNNTDPAAATDINIPATLTEPPLATTQVNFAGNLDAFQQVNQPGGIENIDLLPLGLGVAAGTTLLQPGVFVGDAIAANNEALQQVGNANTGINGPGDAGGIQGATTSASWTKPIVELTANTLAVVQADAGQFAWDQQPPIPPAKQVSETVYNSNGNPVQITVNFYQVNDLGAAGLNNPNGPNQVAYAWYAFNTTNGAPVSTATLVGGTGIIEGDTSDAQVGYDRDITGDLYWGDLIVFNTDGSLLSTGGVEQVGPGGVTFQAMPDIYIPANNINGANPPVALPLPGDNGANAPASPLPTIGAQIMQVQMNFGNAGVLGVGQRNGLYSDADGTYQVINGVNTYVPNSTAYAASQNGYGEGLLQSIQFNTAGQIEGTFSNGQTTALGQVILAEPNNPDGLASVGNNYYQTSPNSGPMFVGTAGQLDLGTVQGDTLELSNVDLSVELSNMIIAQRGFETAARVIAVESADLQTLTQLGQGG
jgi:flagellar hook protein FlgE